jgi:hypothetical protein
MTEYSRLLADLERAERLRAERQAEIARLRKIEAASRRYLGSRMTGPPSLAFKAREALREALDLPPSEPRPIAPWDRP